MNGLQKVATERFWEKVEKTPTCWLWKGAKRHRGYGDAWWNGRHFAAHRLSYSWLVGPIPEGETVDHKCGVTSCVNPKHLQTMPMIDNCRLGSPAQNTNCHRGHPYDGRNVIWCTDAKGRVSRICRICKQEKDRRYHWKNRERINSKKRAAWRKAAGK